MPFYDYRCSECGHVKEVHQGIKEKKLEDRDPPMNQCPKCKRMTLYRVIGKGSGVQFIGNGFAETDIHNRRWRK